jgi:uncharacterized membrane protein YhaH (DUF805 family)
MRKPLQPLNRQDYWLRVVPILVGHIALTAAMAAGVQGMSAVDTVLIIFLAIAVARRFRDIGWPVWIGPTFVIVTMIVAPLGFIGYAFTAHPTPAELLQWLNLYGLFSAPANLLLLVVAGCMPGRPPDASVAEVFG